MRDRKIRPQGRSVRRPGATIGWLDFGGSGPPVVLLHGLAGTAHEWADTAAWLTSAHRVIALDQRGHGESERRPADVSRDAFVSDVVALIEKLDLGPVSLLGQSLGAHTAFLAAARHPRLVQALVVAEASPAPTTPTAVAEVREWLASWPVPFRSRENARAFFGGETLRAEAWTSGLEERDGGWWPSFDADVLVAALSATVGESSWHEWERIEAPTLIVRAANGELTASEAGAMAMRLRGAQVVEIADAGHDVHLEAPHPWREAVEAFLTAVAGD